MRQEGKAWRVRFALALGYLGGAFTMVFYLGIGIWASTQGEVSQSEGFLFLLRTALILALCPGLGAYALTRKSHYEDASLEKHRVVAFQLGIVSIILTVWIPLGAILRWLLLPTS